jgi:hypothetical protein
VPSASEPSAVVGGSAERCKPDLGRGADASPRPAGQPGGVLYVVIAACEVGFWLVLAAGLVVRYALRRPRLGAALLICVPLVDLVLLGATTLDLRRGATATSAHGLAAAYLGFSVAFGHSMTRWADRWFAYRFAGGPKPSRPPRRGPDRVRYEWREWGRAVLAWAIACGLLGLAIPLVDDPERTAGLRSWMRHLTVVVVVWFIAFPLWETLRHEEERDIRPREVTGSAAPPSTDQTGKRSAGRLPG